MTGIAAASVACALAAAMLTAIAGVAQQQSASAVPDSRSLVGGLLRSPRWWAGTFGDGGSYALQVVALALGSVLVVQPLLVTALLFALPIAAYVEGRRLTRTTWLLAGALCLSLGVFLLVGNPTEGNVDAAATRWALPLGAVLAVAAIAAAIGSLTPTGARLTPGLRALLLGAAGGILYGVAVAFTKHVTDLFEHGLPAVLSSWQAWALVAAGLGGYYLQQRAFQAGPLSASLPALTIGEPIAAMFLGMAVLGERLRVDGSGLVLVACAVAVMLLTTVGLSRAQAAPPAVSARETVPPPETPSPR